MAAAKMKVAGFEFRDGARFQKGAVQDPKAVGAHLEMLKKRAKGELTPQDVLDDAKGHNSPLHSFFEWDDTAAAQQHRLNQARGLIRSVVAIYTSATEPAKRMAAYVHIAEGETSHYRSTDHAMAQKATRDQVLQRAWREFVSWRNRYKDLEEFSKLIAVSEEIETTLSIAS